MAISIQDYKTFNLVQNPAFQEHPAFNHYLKQYGDQDSIYTHMRPVINYEMEKFNPLDFLKAELNLVTPEIIKGNKTKVVKNTSQPNINYDDESIIVKHNEEASEEENNPAELELETYVGKPLNQRQVIRAMRKFYKSKNLNKHAINALIGVALSESGLDINAINKEEKNLGLSGYGKGLFQWSDSRKKPLYEKYGNNPTLELQLEFSWEEILQRPKLLNLLQSAKTIDEAVDYVHRGYLNGSSAGLATPEQMQQIYQNSWKKAYNKDYDYNKSLNKRIQNAYNVEATV